VRCEQNERTKQNHAVATYDNRNHGALFRNERKQPGSEQPDHTGVLNIAGREYKISAWLRESKEGNKFFSLAVTPADEGKAHRSVAPVDDSGVDEASADHHDLIIHPMAAANILALARRVFPAPRGRIGPGFTELLDEFGVTDVARLTEDQGMQVQWELEQMTRTEAER
jgi:hypothetical protein